MKGKTVGLSSIFRCFLAFVFICGLVSISGCGQKDGKESAENAKNNVVSKENIQKNIVAEGDTIKVEYSGRLTNGTVFDKSPEGKPLEFIVGKSKLISGFHKAVKGMKLKEEKEVLINASDAYGERNEKLIKEFPIDSLPKDMKPQRGMVIKLQDSTGRMIPGVITSINEKTVTVDLNHPLSGKDLIFNIKVVSIE